MSCTTYKVEVDGCVDGMKTVNVDLYAGLQGATGPSGAFVVGATGASGLSIVGATGASGLSVVGATGASGLSVVGATGASGLSIVGATGASGASVVGATGSTGPASTVPGATGATGPMPSSASGTYQTTRFLADGSASSFGPLTGYQSGDTGAQYVVQLDGILQDPDPTNGAYVIAANQINFSSAPPANVQIVVRRLNITLA